jgi:hypothetical protein
MGNPGAPLVNEKNIRLVGDGEAILTYLGIDWGVDPKDRSSWKVNQTRTNNCLANNQPTANCQDPSVNYYYNNQKENSWEKNFSALTEASERGLPLTSDVEFTFTVQKKPLGSSSTQAPVDYKFSQIVLEEASLELVPCANPKGCVAVKVSGEDNPRPPLEDSEDISFLVGYNQFPADYKVYAVNSVNLKYSNDNDGSCDTSKTSSFFKANMLIIKIDCQHIFPYGDYVFIDMHTRRGVLTFFPQDWVENSLVKFRYRNLNQINLKTLTP